MRNSTILANTTVGLVSTAPCAGRDGHGWLLYEAYVAALHATRKEFLTDNTYLLDGVIHELEIFIGGKIQ